MTQRERLRVAVRLQQHWQRGLERQWEVLQPITEVISPHLRRLREAERLLRMAHEQGYTLSKPFLFERVTNHARYLRITLQDRESHHYPAQQEFALRDFYQDLLQLEEEFPQVRVDWDQYLLIVVTDPIVLNDIELGPFSIRLNWADWTLHQSLQAVQVLAEDPHPAELNADITHPHVREGELCAGDAQESLLKAFQQGRLAEAFLLIKAVLTCYNPRSAYVSLENWYGTACNSCGDIVDEDDRSYCEACQHDYCPSCSECCATCGSCRCLSCLESCSGCDSRCCPDCLELTRTHQSVCRNCRETCPGCHQLMGPGDLDTESGLCHDCTPESVPFKEASHEAVSTAAS